MPNRLQQPLSIGSLTIPNRVLLAPLAGVSDIPFRRICQEMGAGLTYVEMLAANAMHHRNSRTQEMMARHAAEPQLGVQLTGPTVESVAAGVRLLNAKPFDTVDINMGCPVRKVVHNGSGSGFLRDPNRVTETVKAAVGESRAPLTVKIRLGFSREDKNVTDIADRVARAGAAMLTIHGRCKSENYSVPVDLLSIREGAEAAREGSGGRIVVIGNGDIFSPKDALRMLEHGGVDGVMVSRGALGSPWIFRQILGRMDGEPTVVEWRDVILRHLEYHAEHYAPYEELAPLLFRKHLMWYFSGYPGARGMRPTLGTLETLEAIRETVLEYADTLPATLPRFATREEMARHKLAQGFDPKFDMDRELDRGVGGEG
ncbi:MAG: tRNA-dihydrouridine synthase [Kiritimatiellia bacterium]